MHPLVRTLVSLSGIAPAWTDADLKEVAGRRRAPRFRTELAMHWPGGTGVIWDISSTGLRFETNNPISVGEKMKFTIVVPDEEAHKSPRHTLCDSEIHWTAPSPTVLQKLSVGASFTKIKSIETPLAG